MYYVSYSQKNILMDSIKICYSTGKLGGAISGKDHCVTIWNEGGEIYCERRCYGMDIERQEYENSLLNNIDTTLTQKLYQISQEKAILQFFQKNKNFMILDTCIKINQSQFNDFNRIMDEIISFGEKNDISESKNLIVTTRRNSYVIKKNNKTSIVIDWFGVYDKSIDIEKSLGLRSYNRCPCMILD